MKTITAQSVKLIPGIMMAIILLVGVRPVAMAAPGDDLTPKIFLPLIVSPPTGTSGVLTNGGTVSDADGATVGAVIGALAAPLTVTIEKVPPPAIAMPSGAQVHGDYYHVKGAEDLRLPADKPLVFGLPVPDGVSSSNLAIAKLVSPDEIMDSDTTSEEWVPLLGVFDQSAGLFAITLPSLNRQGATFVLIEHPDLAPLPEAPLYAPSAAAAPNAYVSPGFYVTCWDFDDPTRCGPADEAKLASALETNHQNFLENKISGSEDRPVALQNFHADIDPPAVQEGMYHNIFIVPKEKHCGKDNGRYHNDTQQLGICLGFDDGGKPEKIDNDKMKRTIRHELFHAHQIAYDSGYIDPANREDWVYEGTAAAIETESAPGDGAWHRSPDYNDPPVRFADTPLNSKVKPEFYLAQDFWIYVGLQNGEFMSYMDEIFKMGLTTDKVAAAMEGEKFKQDFKSAYFGWVTNQVMEKNFDTAEGELGAACNFLQYAAFDLENTTLAYGYEYPGALAPLDTVVVKISFGPDQRAAAVHVTEREDPYDYIPELSYKIYINGEDGCQDVAPGWRLFQVSSSEEYYAVISNVDHTADPDHAIEFWLWLEG